MDRTLEKHIVRDMPQKIILLSGPRQSGKTTLAKMLNKSFDYLNFDNSEHRLAFNEKTWDRNKKLVVFDELHKMKNWKTWLKGIYDTEGLKPHIVVTGSARLDLHRKAGDSLAGRFFAYRLHPLDMKEIEKQLKPKNITQVMNMLLEVGGFPEPYLKGSSKYYKRWKKTHLDIILKQDLIDLENVREITSIETLIQLLRKSVGSTISYSSLARDLQCSDKTVKKWITLLENMYVIFKVLPFHKNVARAVLKAPKIYFYDTGQVLGNRGTKLENLVACALLKELHFRQDCIGEESKLHFLRTKDGEEIDFLLVINEKPHMMIEVKLSDEKPSSSFRFFKKTFKNIPKIQLVQEIKREKTYPNGTQIRKADLWLTKIDI